MIYKIIFGDNTAALRCRSIINKNIHSIIENELQNGSIILDKFHDNCFSNTIELDTLR